MLLHLLHSRGDHADIHFRLGLLPELLLDVYNGILVARIPFLQCNLPGEAAFLVDDCPLVRVFGVLCISTLLVLVIDTKELSPLRVVGAVSRQNYCVDDGIGVTRNAGRGETRAREDWRRTPKLRAAYLSLFCLI